MNSRIKSNNQTVKTSNITNQEDQEVPTSRNPNTMPRSRLKKSMERKTKQQIFLMIVGMLAIIILLAVFAVPLLVNYSTFLQKIKGNQDISTTNNDTTDFVSPPILSQTFTATNSAQISISGTATAKQTIKLYVNDELQDKTTVKDNGTFNFKEVSLDDGDNVIKTKAVDDKKNESAFSNELDVAYKNKAPSLSIDSPADNQIVTGDDNRVQVTGKTDPGVKVTVNGFWAIVDDTGKYQYSLTLQQGDNPYKVIATDQAGNTTEQDRKVIYNH